MTVEQAKQKFTDAVSSKMATYRENGFTVSGKVYYSDKALSECTEFNENVILLFGAVKVGLPDMDEDDFCTIGLCCEIRLGAVDDAEMEKELSEFDANTNTILDELLSSPEKLKKIQQINLRQEKEAEKSMQEFNTEMHKMKIKLYSALGILVFIVAAIMIGSFFI